MIDRALSRSEEQLVQYYTDTANNYRNWGGYSELSGIYAIHSGFHPNGVAVEQRESIQEMDRQILARLQLNLNEVRRLADLGCGTGAITIQAALSHPRVEVVGVTIVPDQAEVAQRYIYKHGIPNARVEVGNYLNLCYPEGHFDRVCFVESLTHTTQKLDALKEACRVLKPGGKLLIQDPILTREVGTPDPFYPLVQTFIKGFCLFACERPISTLLKWVEAVGFDAPRVEDVTPNIFPSAKLIGDHAEMRLREEPEAAEDVKLRRQACMALRQLMSEHSLGKNVVGYYFITATKR